MRLVLLSLLLSTACLVLVLTTGCAPTVVDSKPARVVVEGEVKKPGAYEVPANTHIVELITLAGGFTGIADMKRVQLQRAGKTTVVNVRALFDDSGRILRDFPVRDGDKIHVNEVAE